MRSILYLVMFLVSVAGAIFVGMKVSFPSVLKTAAKECPFELNPEKVPVMVVRVIDNSDLPSEFSRRCFLSQLTEKEGVIFVNRENEPQILEELAHQSEIPASDSSIQPIGEILVPSHLLVMNGNGNKVEVSLSEVKSGIFIFKESFSFNPMLESAKEHSESIYRFIIGVMTLMAVFSIQFIFTCPLFTYLHRREEIRIIEHKFQLAKNLIGESQFMKAGDLLVECARSPHETTTRNTALQILKNLSTLQKG